MRRSKKVQKVISVVGSCETVDQLNSTINWYNNLNLYSQRIEIFIIKKAHELCKQGEL